MVRQVVWLLLLIFTPLQLLAAPEGASSELIIRIPRIQGLDVELLTPSPVHVPPGDPEPITLDGRLRSFHNARQPLNISVSARADEGLRIRKLTIAAGDGRRTLIENTQSTGEQSLIGDIQAGVLRRRWISELHLLPSVPGLYTITLDFVLGES